MLAFDHLVVYSNSIKNAAEAFVKEHNQIIVPGGHHENWGTYNYLAYMKNNSYIEWLGIENVTKAIESDNPLIQQTANANKGNLQGPIQFALRTTEMNILIDHYKKQGIPYKGPYPGSRRKPDGSILKWRMLFPIDDSFKGVLPFLIEWEGERNRPNDITQINSISFSTIRVGVNHIEESVSLFKDLYQLGNPLHDTYPEWELENGNLQVVQDVNLEAQFQQIHFKR